MKKNRIHAKDEKMKNASMLGKTLCTLRETHNILKI